jgi:hypothetical protein
VNFHPKRRLGKPFHRFSGREMVVVRKNEPVSRERVRSSFPRTTSRLLIPTHDEKENGPILVREENEPFHPMLNTFF